MRVEDVSFDNPLFAEMVKYPVRFSSPVFFGAPHVEPHGSALNNGTGTLIKLGKRYIGVTCEHNLVAYRQAQIEGTVFCFGPIEIEPEEHLISENHYYDLAVFDLTPFVDSRPDFTAARFLEPTRWPPGPVSIDDVICLAGFPGIWREHIKSGYLRFYSFSSGAGQVHAAGDHHLMTRVDLQKCLVQIDNGKVLGSLGGLSGGPVFVWRKGPILTAELVGFVHEYQESLDLMRVTAANLICSDGTLI